MTAHRAALPVKTEVSSGGQGRPRYAVEPAALRHARQLGQPAPVLDQLVSQPSAACGLRPRPESVRTARDFAGRVLCEWGMAGLADVAELVVSELVTNALWHGLAPGQFTPAECPVRLRLLGQAPYVMCLVTDPGRGIPVLREPDPCAENGRGLNVVDSCCLRWGWHLLDGGGKVVWAVLHPTG